MLWWFLVTKSFFTLSLVCCSDTGVPGAFHEGWHCTCLYLWTGWMPNSLPGRFLWQGYTAVFKNAWHLERSSLWICEFFFSALTLIIHHHPSHLDLPSSIINHPFSWPFFKLLYHSLWCVCLSLQEQYFFPSKYAIGKQKCHTYDIFTPDDKENVKRLGVSNHLINFT